MNMVKLNAADITIGGKKVRVEVVRDSALCRFLTKKEFIALWNTIYLRDKKLTQKVLFAGLADVMKRYKIGFIRYYWNLLTNVEN